MCSTKRPCRSSKLTRRGSIPSCQIMDVSSADILTIIPTSSTGGRTLLHNSRSLRHSLRPAACGLIIVNRALAPDGDSYDERPVALRAACR